MAMESKENLVWQGDNFNSTTGNQKNTKYLNYTGLMAFWEKAKGYVNAQDKAVFESVNTKVNNQDKAIRDYIESLVVNGQLVVRDPGTGLGTSLAVTIGGEDIAVRRVADNAEDVAWKVKDESGNTVSWDVNKEARGHSYSDGNWKVDDAIENIDARLDAVQTELLEGVVSGLNVTSSHGTYKNGTEADTADDVENKKWVTVTGSAYSTTKQVGNLTLNIDDTAINEQFNSLDDKINFLEANAGVTNIKVTDIDDNSATNKNLVELSLKGSKMPNGQTAEDAEGVTDAQRRGDIEIILDESGLDAKLDAVDATVAAEVADRKEDIANLAGAGYTVADGSTAGAWSTDVSYKNITAISDRLAQIDANLVTKIVDGNNGEGDADKNDENEKYVSFTVAETATGNGENDKIITLTLDDNKLQDYIENLNAQLGNIGETKINGETLLTVTKNTDDNGYESITLVKSDVTLDTSNIDRPAKPSQGPASSTKNLEETLEAYDSAFAALVSATEFKGVVTWDPTKVTITADGVDAAGVAKYKITDTGITGDVIMQNGDIVISTSNTAGDKEFILDANHADGPVFVELGDVTAEAARLDAIETWIDSNIITEADITGLDFTPQTFTWVDLA